jgi:hypothetical protein
MPRSDDAEKKNPDLAGLFEPTTFSTTELGYLRVNLNIRSFHDWVSDNVSRNNLDARSLVKALLLQQASTDDGELLSMEQVSKLENEGLDDIAKSLIEAAWIYLSPRYILDQKTGELRKRSGEERYSLSGSEEDTPQRRVVAPSY